MKRYDLIVCWPHGNVNDPNVDMEQDPIGEWVRYADIEALVVPYLGTEVGRKIHASMKEQKSQ